MMNIKTKIRDTLNSITVNMQNKSLERYFINEKKCVTSTKVSKEQYNKAREYFSPYFKLNPLFHSFYTEKTGKFEVNYIPDNMWFTIIDRHFNNREKTKVLDHKSYYERMFAGRNVKFPETILHRINGFLFDSKMNMITREEAEQIIKKEKSLFVKVSTGTCGGRGVHHISAENILEEFRKLINNNDDIVVQRSIKQHPELSRVGANSVNSLRIVSLLTAKEVKIYSSILRMGIGESKVDNASSGGISSGVEGDGRLKDVAYKMLGERFDCHPTTKVRFSDVVIPSYDKAIGLVKELHPLIPDFRLVSWDIAIDEDAQPVLIEVNMCMGGLDFHQLNNGPIFKEDTTKILEEVFKKQ